MVLGIDCDVWALSVLPDSGQERAQALPFCDHWQLGKREKEPGLFAWCMIRLFRPVHTAHVKPDTHTHTQGTYVYTASLYSVVESDWHRALTYSNCVFPLTGEQHSPQDRTKTEMVRVRKVSMIFRFYCSCIVFISASVAHPWPFHLLFHCCCPLQIHQLL